MKPASSSKKILTKTFSSGDGFLVIHLNPREAEAKFYVTPSARDPSLNYVVLKGKDLGKFIAWLKEEGYKG